MRRRLYFVLPDVETAQQTTNDLLLARIEDRRIHCLGKRDSPMGSLHQANVFQKSDIVHGAELGLMIGGAAGLILGAIAVLAPPSGVHLQFVTILIAALAGAFFGAWISSLVAASVPNSRLLDFAKDIEAGKILMIVDVPSRRVEEIQQLVERQHPEAGHGRIEATMPAFP